MQVRKFHTGRQNVMKAPVLCDGKVSLHSVIDGKAVFRVGTSGKHEFYLFVSPDDLYALLSVRDILKAAA